MVESTEPVGHVTKEKLAEWLQVNWSGTLKPEEKGTLEILTWDSEKGQQKLTFECGQWLFTDGKNKFLIIKVNDVEILHMHLGTGQAAFHITRGGLLNYKID